MSRAAEVWDDRLRRHFGLTMLDHPARLQDGIRAACKELGGASEADLVIALDRGDPRAKMALARALTIGETYFFREQIHLDHFRDVLLPAAIARGQFPIIVVSAGCSSGEEAYTLAILARQTLGADADRKVRVLGFDLNPQSVATARRGVYRPWSLRGMSEDVKRRWFDEVPDGASVKAEVRALVSFEPKNLVAADDALAPSSVDIVFCRNVLIYFDDDSARIALATLDRALRPGGSLIVGSAEAAFFTIAGLGAHEIGDGWVHARDEKPATRAKQTPAPISSPRRPPPRRLRSKPTSDRHPLPVVAPAPAPGPAPSTDVDTILAEGWKQLAIEPVVAADAARRAILLDRTLAAGHVLAASAALALRDLPAARASLRHARRALVDCAPGAVVRGADGATAAELGAYCARLEKALPR